MFRGIFAVRRLAAIAAAAALSAGCSSTGALPAQTTGGAAHADIRVRTPLVDDDGWPMPADPPLDDRAHGAGAQQVTR